MLIIQSAFFTKQPTNREAADHFPAWSLGLLGLTIKIPVAPV